ncbi:MAG: methionyl-tRNA formyltransferase, partial [Bacteroidetes bacterium]|nr:methionyl-tRNA formyltransferase [Bacteroidota bacterium]
VKIFLTEKEIVSHTYITGSVFCDGRTVLKVAVKDGYIIIKTLQLAGKKKMDTPEVLRGFQMNDNWKFIV